MASKLVKIDWKLIEQLLMAGCSGVQAAAYIGVHENTLYKRCKLDNGVEFVAFQQEKRAKGDTLLHSAQFDKAYKDKDTSMLIWLGKNRLGQKDKSEVENTITTESKMFNIIIEK
jgi:hypothetical protein